MATRVKPKLPIIPVNMRVYLLHQTKATNQMQELMDAVAGAVAYWRENACIELLWYKETIEVLDIEGLGLTNTSRIPLDRLWKPRMDWIPVYFTGKGTDEGNSEVGVDSAGFSYIGKTHFAQPWSGRPGYGCVLPENMLPDGGWNAVAHEIGHALGLPHLDCELPENKEIGEKCGDGNRKYTEVCMSPFTDDLLYYRFATDTANLMTSDGGNEPRADPNKISLSENQVRRARLTITARSCPYAPIYHGEPWTVPDNYLEFGPLMSDLPVHFIMSVFT